MSDLTDHQRSILIAMLQGRRIESRLIANDDYGFYPCDTAEEALLKLCDSQFIVRIAPNQDEAVRLYGEISPFVPVRSFKNAHSLRKADDTHYIDISPNGFIVGGKIEAV